MRKSRESLKKVKYTYCKKICVPENKTAKYSYLIKLSLIIFIYIITSGLVGVFVLALAES